MLHHQQERQWALNEIENRHLLLVYLNVDKVSCSSNSRKLIISYVMHHAIYTVENQSKWHTIKTLYKYITLRALNAEVRCTSQVSSAKSLL